jgi:hypothetical protein
VRRETEATSGREKWANTGRSLRRPPGGPTERRGGGPDGAPYRAR